MTSAKKTRTRLSPELRKSMILDHAAALIAAEGVSAVSMERLGREAGISKALVYTYYPSLKELLQILLKREYKRLRKLQAEAADSAETIEQMVRRVTHAYLAYIEERGLIIDRLAAEPSVADHGDPTEYNRDGAVLYLANILSEEFGIDPTVACPVVDISYGLPSAAGHYLSHHDVSRQTIEDITVTMILGSLNEVVKNYAVSLRPLRKARQEKPS